MAGNISFSGLLSGVSTDEIISALVSFRRTPITQLENIAEQRGFERKAYQQVNQSIVNFQASLLNLRLQSTFLSKTVSISSPSLLTATAGFNAAPSTHSMTIQSIARGAKAISGLGDRSLERASAKLLNGNSSGITGIGMNDNSLGGTRALSDTLLRNTLQAGTGENEITAGDRIKIDVTLKDGSTNTAYFTFTGGPSDTMSRLAQTIRGAFKGEAQVTIDSNGAFLITETNPSTVTSFSLDGLTFIDEDFSGSTFNISLGNTTSGNLATSRMIVGTKTFTTGSSANIATTADTLISLDQFSGGSLSGDEVINISGTRFDGVSVSSSFAIDSLTTLGDLLSAVEAEFNSAPPPPYDTVVSFENGKFVLTDTATGASSTEIFLNFSDPDGNLKLNLGAFVVTEAGSADISQTIRTSAFQTPASGKYILTSTEGKAGKVTGTVSLRSDTLLTDLGVTNPSLFTIDRDDGGGIKDPVTIFGLNSRSSVQDLIDAINAQTKTVTAQLVPDGTGNYFLQLTSVEGGTDFRLTDESTGNGILEKVLNLDTLGIDTDISTLTHSALSSVESATTDADDFTFTAIFTPSNGGPVQRRTVTGDEGSPITNLIENVQLNGLGNTFAAGTALIYTSQSSELNVGPATATHYIGGRGVSNGTLTTTPSLNIYTTINNSGLATALTSGTFTINGVRITIDSTTNQTLDEIMGMVNSSGAGVVMEYDDVHDRFVLYRPDAGNTSPITLGAPGDTSNFFNALRLTANTGGQQYAGTSAGNVNASSSLAFAGLSIPAVSGVFTINGVKITVNVGADSLNDIIDRINRASAGVIASYDSVQDRLTLSQDLSKPPLYNRISIGSATDTSNFLAAMRLTDSYQTPQYIGSERQKAEFILDGQNYVRDTNTISDVLNDVQFTLRGVSDTPISLDITSDTSRATEAIADFVVRYNELMKTIDVPALTDDERKGLPELTEAQRAKLTFSEIDAYEQKREQLWIQQSLHNSSTVGRLNNFTRLNLISPVLGVDSSAIRMLSQIGITTGDIGLGVELARTPFLVTDSTDRDEILAKLNSNTTLQNALETKAEEVMNLFSADYKSTASITGNRDLSLGFALPSELRFSVSDGSNTATITFSAGFHTSSQILSVISNSLSQAGLAGKIRVTRTDGGFIQFIGETTSGQSRISIQELSSGGLLPNYLGISSQVVTGTDAAQNAGIARRLETMLDGYAGNQGIIKEKIKFGGLIDQDLTRIARRIVDYEYRLTLYEARLKRDFAAMESALASFASTSSFLQAQLNAASALTSRSNSGGISLSL